MPRLSSQSQWQSSWLNLHLSESKPSALAPGVRKISLPGALGCDFEMEQRDMKNQSGKRQELELGREG